MKSSFTEPSLELIHEIGCSMGLPPNEREKFFAYFESVGWVIGRSRKPMKSIRGAMATWKMNVDERKESLHKVHPTVEMSNNRDHLKRVEAEILKLRNQKPFAKGDGKFEQLQKHKTTESKLLKLLGYSV